jgi:hypothetical protein
VFIGEFASHLREQTIEHLAESISPIRRFVLRKVFAEAAAEFLHFSILFED